MKFNYLGLLFILCTSLLGAQASLTSTQNISNLDNPIIYGERVFKLFQESDNLLRFGNSEQAIIALDNAITINPTFVEGYLKRATVLAKVGRLEAAKKDLRTAQLLNPYVSNFLGYHNKANSKQNIITDTLLYQVLMEEEHRRDDQLQLYVNEAIQAKLNGEFSNAIDYVRSLALMENPPRALLYTMEGNIHLLCGNYEEAILHYTKAIQLRPELPNLYFKRGVAQLFTYNRSSACEDLLMSQQLGHVKGEEKLKYFCFN